MKIKGQGADGQGSSGEKAQCLPNKLARYPQDQVHRPKPGEQSNRPSRLPIAMRPTPQSKSTCFTPCPHEWERRSPPPVPSAPSPGLVLFNSEDQSDVAFLVGLPPNDWRFPAHSFILASASPAFRDMLQGHIEREGLQRQMSVEYRIVDVPPDVFQTLLRFMYKHEVTLSSVPGALQLLHAANRYTMIELQNCCLHFLLQNVSKNNVLEIIQNLRPFLGANGLHENDNLRNELVMQCFCLIDNNADFVLKTEAFENVDQDTVSDITKRNTLCLSSELVVFEALDRWACQECKRRRLELRPENKRMVLSTMLYHVRFFVMTAEEFMLAPAKSGVLSEEEKLAILSKIHGNCTEPLPETLCNVVTRPRKPQKLVIPKNNRKSDFSPLSDISLASSTRSPTGLPQKVEMGPKKKTAWKKVRRGLRDFVICLLQVLD